MFNLKNIRSDFPILAKTRNNKPFIYFDNAATTQKPKVVIDKICDFYSNYNSNIQRGMYFLADKATSEYEKSREIISKFLNSNLKEENANLLSEIEQKNIEINNLKDKIKIISISKSVDASKGDIRQTKLKINEYIREIDKCIAQLNN